MDKPFGHGLEDIGPNYPALSSLESSILRHFLTVCITQWSIDFRPRIRLNLVSINGLMHRETLVPKARLFQG
jgi:hypothetical protein